MVLIKVHRNYYYADICLIIMNSFKRTKVSDLPWQPNKIINCDMHDQNKRPDGLTSSAASGNALWNTPKHTHNKHVKQEGCETSRKYIRKWLKTWIMFYLGAQNDPEIGPLRLILNIPLKVAQIDMLTKTDAKPVESFEKMTKDRNFHLFWCPKWPKKLDRWGSYSPHI